MTRARHFTTCIVCFGQGIRGHEHRDDCSECNGFGVVTKSAARRRDEAESAMLAAYQKNPEAFR